VYDDGFKNASFFLNELERLKNQVDESGKFIPFQFIVSRVTPNGVVLFDTNIQVTLEDYKIIDDVKNMFDVSVDITLKQYKTFGTKIVEIKESQATIESDRPSKNSPKKKTYTVVKGDCLWAIAKKYLGNGRRYVEIYELNKKVIDKRNKGTGNTKYTIYPGQVFKLP
jgi:nucleoid-associated protein YgaU